MNKENIMLIVGFVIILINVAVSAIITMYILPKHHTTYNNGLNNIVYDTKQMKETFTKNCTSDAIKTKGIIEHPSTLEGNR